MRQARDASFVTSDGVRLTGRVWGNAKGPPVLFCYGLVCSPHHFKYQWEHLGARYRLHMLDYRAHGDSDQPDSVSSLTFRRLIEDFAEFLAHEKVRAPVNLVGHSMGVNLALEFYARFPEKVASLSLIAGGATFPANSRAELQGLAAVQSLMKIVDGVFPSLVEEFWKLQRLAPAGAERFAGLVGFNPKLSKPEDIRKVIEVMSGFSPSVFFQLFGEYVRHDRSALLPEIEVPTLVIAGGQDRMVPGRFTRSLHEAIPGSRLVSVEDGSHCPQFDRPDEVNAALAAFLSEASEKASAARVARCRPVAPTV